MASPNNFVMNATLPFYPTGNVSGAILHLTQSPCNDPYRRPMCCGPSHHGEGLTCANWTGAHLVSRGCVLYGTLTAEMAMLMPEGSRAFLDVGTYVRGGSPDATQNELDLIFRTLSVSLSGSSSSDTESSTGVSASNKTRSFVASTWDATFFNPGEQKEVFGPSTWPHHYTGFMARQYHNYSIHWTPDYITWSLDKVVYRNVSRLRHCLRRHCWGIPTVTLIPWRPQTIRIILRTEDGTTLDPQPDSMILLRRLSYTPLEARVKEHAHPALFIVRQVVFFSIFAFVAFKIIRCSAASFEEVEEDLRRAFSGEDSRDGQSNGERRKRMEMTPLLHARVNSQGNLVEMSPEKDPVYRTVDSPPVSQRTSPQPPLPSPRRSSPSDVDSMPLPWSPAAGSTPDKRRRIRGQ